MILTKRIKNRRYFYKNPKLVSKGKSVALRQYEAIYEIEDDISRGKSAEISSKYLKNVNYIMIYRTDLQNFTKDQIIQFLAKEIPMKLSKAIFRELERDLNETAYNEWRIA